MKPTILGSIVGVAVTPIALGLALISSGGGHGDYLAARVLFPAPMLTAAFLGRITVPGLLLAGIQFPAYGWLIGASWNPGRRRLWVVPVAFHFATLAWLLGFLGAGD